MGTHGAERSHAQDKEHRRGYVCAQRLCIASVCIPSLGGGAYMAVVLVFTDCVSLSREHGGTPQPLSQVSGDKPHVGIARVSLRSRSDLT